MTHEESSIALAIYTFEEVLAKMPAPKKRDFDWRTETADCATLDYLNTEWAIKVIKDNFTRKRKEARAK